MYFLSKNNTALYSSVAQMRSFYRYLMSVTGIGVALYIWFLCVYKPAQAVVVHHQKMVQQLHVEYNRCDESHGVCKNLIASIKRLEGELAFYGGPLNRENGSATPIMLALETAQKSGLQLNGCTMQKEQDKKWYTYQTVDFDFEGSLAQQLNFFTAFKNSGKLVGCDQLRINAIRENRYHLTCSLDMVVLK